MEREVRGEDGISWTFTQAYAGVSGTAGAEAAGRAAEQSKDQSGAVPVVCTPSREEETVRLHLPEGWVEKLSDEDLLHALAQARLGA